MFETEIEKYKSLNQLAESDGIVIFGGAEDVGIPLGELKQAFSLSDHIYNRSIAGLSATDAARAYDKCAKELCPETVLLHIGEADVQSFNGNEAAFEEGCRNLIGAIRAKNKRTRIVVVPLKNYENDAVIAKLNKSLSYIADSEKCEFEDISAKRVWNAKENREVTSFLYEIGFDSPLNIKRPIYNLVRILFCYEGNQKKH